MDFGVKFVLSNSVIRLEYFMAMFHTHVSTVSLSSALCPEMLRKLYSEDLEARHHLRDLVIYTDFIPMLVPGVGVDA